MRTLYRALLLLALILSGCATSEQVTGTWGRARHRYPERDLVLNLAQDEATAALVITLRNTSSHPITNYFPQTVFEGSVWVLQEGAVPLQTYPTNYFNLMMRACWGNPEVALPAGASLSYQIPLESLICPFSSRQPDGTRPVLAYASMDGFEAASNVIPLKSPERIPWLANAGQRGGARQSGR
jgi:hypothetical protein